MNPVTTPTLSELSVRLTQAENRAQSAENRYVRAEKRFRVLCGALFGAITFAVSLPFVSPAIAQGYGVTLAQLATRMTSVETKTAAISAINDVDGNATVRFTNVNVQIVSGSGSTEGVVNGRGNLIVGYNERAGVDGATHTGSHNIVTGLYQDYSSHGGLVMGVFSNVLAPFASVTGGQGNTASGTGSSVSGGLTNTASGNYSSVSGGTDNIASNYYASVSGGSANKASAFSASVSGGENNNASGNWSSVSGGGGNKATGEDATVCGGSNNTASGVYAAVSGGADANLSLVYGWRAGRGLGTTYNGTFISQ